MLLADRLGRGRHLEDRPADVVKRQQRSFVTVLHPQLVQGGIGLQPDLPRAAMLMWRCVHSPAGQSVFTELVLPVSPPLS